jgi:transposase
MGSRYRKFDEDFKKGAVQLVLETGKPIAQVARDLGVNEGTLGNWVTKARRKQGGEGAGLSETERAELERLRRDVVELRMQGDVLKRSVALWVDEAMGR